MPSLGPRSLDVTCNACHRRAIVNVDRWPDHLPVQSFGVCWLNQQGLRITAASQKAIHNA